MKRGYKVRFNLGRGKNYMKWKVEGPTGIKYYNPEEVQLHLHGCQLKNQRATAEKINKGANKTVCAWVRCEGAEIFPAEFLTLNEVHDTQFKYNPRKHPFWFMKEGVSVDNLTVSRIVSFGRQLYYKPDELEKVRIKVGISENPTDL